MVSEGSSVASNSDFEDLCLKVQVDNANLEVYVPDAAGSLHSNVDKNVCKKRRAYRPLSSIRRFYRPICNGDDGIATIYLGLWFVVNVIITISSKAIFSHLNFPYPMMLTCIHCAVTGLGSQIMSYTNVYPSARVTPKQILNVLLFSFVFTINIWLSNYGLLVVSVAVHQISRTTIPLFTMVLSLLLYKETYPWRTLPSVLLVIVGVAATVWGDMSMTLYGGCIVAAGCAFSSLKGLMSQKAQVGSAGLHTFDLLRIVCPLAVMELLILGIANGELMTMMTNLEPTDVLYINLACQGLLAFLVNFLSFKCAALWTPLTMNIAGNVKQVVTALVALFALGGSVTSPLLIGLAATFIGALWYTEESRKVKVAPTSDIEISIEASVPSKIT